MWHRTHAFFAIGVLTFAVTACSRRDAAEQQAPFAPLQAIVERSAPPSYLSHGARGDRVWKTTKAFYKQHGFRPVWTQPDSSGEHRKPLPQTDELIYALKDADRDGLVPDDYQVSRLMTLRETLWNRESRKTVDDKALADADVLLTCMFLEYAGDLAAGRIDPRAIDPQWVEKPREIDFSSTLDRALGADGIKTVLANVPPKHPEYRALQRVLSAYRDIRDKGGWPKVPDKLKLKQGAEHPAVATIRKRLAMTGDFGAESASVLDDTRPVFDEPMARAIANFQTRHGLKPTGEFTPETAAAMNVPVEQRMQQIAINLERWRWLPDQLGDPYIRVNLPAFRLDIFDGGKSVMTQRVIVGKPDSKTPIFSDEMQYIVFSPYWNIPEQIVRDETVPKAMNDPEFLTRNNIEVVGTSGEAIDPGSIDWANAGTDKSLRFRQKPGDDNSLGLVKFIFPNHFNVYLHDTPADALFSRVERDFSHGCMRVEQPLELAEYVLHDQSQWTPEKIDAAMHAGKEQTVKLTKPLPVHVVYFTVMPYENGAVQFRDDLYGYDAVQMRLTGVHTAPAAVPRARSQTS
jgi:murein L,D-transpeptidase YcbB/YkuD